MRKSYTCQKCLVDQCWLLLILPDRFQASHIVGQLRKRDRALLQDFPGLLNGCDDVDVAENFALALHEAKGGTERSAVQLLLEVGNFSFDAGEAGFDFWG
jgi:hypothetical protein